MSLDSHLVVRVHICSVSRVGWSEVTLLIAYVRTAMATALALRPKRVTVAPRTQVSEHRERSVAIAHREAGCRSLSSTA